MKKQNYSNHLELYSLDLKKVRKYVIALIKKKNYSELDDVLALVREELPKELVSLLGLIIKQSTSRVYREKCASRLTVVESTQLLTDHINAFDVKKRNFAQITRLIKTLLPKFDNNELAWIINKAARTSLIQHPSWLKLWRTEFKHRQRHGIDVNSLQVATQIEYFRCADLTSADIKRIADGNATPLAAGIVMKREDYDLFENPKICEAFWMKEAPVRRQCREALRRHLRRSDARSFFEAAPSVGDALQNLLEDSETAPVAAEVLSLGKLATPETFSRLTQQVFGANLLESSETESSVTWNVISIVAQVEEHDLQYVCTNCEEQLESLPASLQDQLKLLEACSRSFNMPLTLDQFRHVLKSAAGAAIIADVPVTESQLRTALQTEPAQERNRLL